VLVIHVGITCNFVISVMTFEDSTLDSIRKSTIAETDDDACMICFDFLGDLSCQGCRVCRKDFHTHCLNKWLSSEDTCPNCREANPRGLPPTAATEANIGGRGDYVNIAQTLTASDAARIRAMNVLALHQPFIDSLYEQDELSQYLSG